MTIEHIDKSLAIKEISIQHLQNGFISNVIVNIKKSIEITKPRLKLHIMLIIYCLELWTIQIHIVFKWLYFCLLLCIVLNMCQLPTKQYIGFFSKTISENGPQQVITGIKILKLQKFFFFKHKILNCQVEPRKSATPDIIASNTGL